MRSVLAVVLIGGALRIGAAWAYRDVPLSRGGDDRQYHALASSIAAGKGYALDGKPSAYRAPLYPLFLAAAMRAAGRSDPGFLRLLQAFLGTLSLWLLYQAVQALHSREAGLKAAWLLALWPEQILLPASLYLECFFALLLILFAWALVRWSQRPAAPRLVLLGLALGASLLTRSTLVLFPLLVLSAMAPELGLLKGRFYRQAALFLACCALPLVPWVWRNAAVFGRFIPFESGVAGPVLYYGALGRTTAPSDEASEEPMRTMFQTMEHLDWDRFAMKEALRAVRAAPGRYLASIPRRAAYLWTDSYACYLLHDHPRLKDALESGRTWDRARNAERLLRLALVLLAAAGVLLAWGFPGTLFLAALILYFDLYAAAAVFIRFMAPATPLLCALAGVGWTCLAESLRKAVE